MLNIGGRDWELVFNLDAIDQMEQRLKTKLDSKSITETMAIALPPAPFSGASGVF